MIQTLVARWEANKEMVRAEFAKCRPGNYIDIVRAVVSAVTSEEYGEECLDPERIHVIDDGDYQGTLLFVIAAKGYQPSTYWYVYVNYGSCSGCDTIQAIHDSDWGAKTPTEQQVSEYMTLALHVLQGIKRMD